MKQSRYLLHILSWYYQTQNDNIAPYTVQQREQYRRLYCAMLTTELMSLDERGGVGQQLEAMRSKTETLRKEVVQKVCRS